MKIFQLLTAQNIAANLSCVSKKEALESLCKLATIETSPVTEKEALNALIEREKKGSTAIGHGVAIPHARLEGLDKAHVACARLSKPLPFDAPDDEPVDLLFIMLIPFESTEEYLEMLSEIAELFSSKTFREQMRKASTNEAFYRIATGKSS